MLVSLEPVLERHPQYRTEKVLDRLVEPVGIGPVLSSVLFVRPVLLLAANFAGQNLFGGPRSQLGQVFSPATPSPADQLRAAFLANTPLGNRLRLGLGANLRGQNLFGGPRSRLAEILGAFGAQGSPFVRP